MEVIAERLRPLLHIGHQVEIAVSSLVDLGGRRPAAIVVAVGIFFRPVIRPFEVGLVGMLLVDDQRHLVDRLVGRRLIRLGQPGEIGRSAVLTGLVYLEGLVVLNLLLDPLLEGQDRQLENLHRLDHARRKHLLLRHPHFLAERHSHRRRLAQSRA